MRRASIIAAAIACIGSTATDAGIAQSTNSDGQPEIIVSGSADIMLPATRASFYIGITTSANSANAANENNARLSKAVTEALRAAHLKTADLVGSRLVVSPRWTYDDKTKRQIRTGFDATNTLIIETERVADLGGYIDAALSAGATDASGIDFSAKDTDDAKHQALSQAVLAARADAEAMAHAAGGALGDLVLLSTERSNEVPGVRLEKMALTAARGSSEQPATDVIPSQIRVTARVDARWRFVPAAKAR